MALPSVKISDYHDAFLHLRIVLFVVQRFNYIGGENGNDDTTAVFVRAVIVRGMRKKKKKQLRRHPQERMIADRVTCDVL